MNSYQKNARLALARRLQERVRNQALGELIAGDSGVQGGAQGSLPNTDPATLFALRPSVTSFCIVDASTSNTATSAFGGPITQAAQQALVAALTIQANQHVAPHYGGIYQFRWMSKDEVAARAKAFTPIPTEEVGILIVDDANDVANGLQPGTMGGHNVNSLGIPTIFASRGHSNSILSGMLGLLTIISHEVCESIGDPSLNTLAEDGQGFEWSVEICDSVQGDGYELAEIPGATLANFVLPSYWNPDDKRGPWDFAKLCTGPFTLRPGGYAIRRPKGGAEVQIYGTIGDEHIARKMLPTSRTARRGAFGSPT